MNKMNLFANGILVFILSFVTHSCGEKDFFTEEQYRKECYIVSGDNNIFGQEFTFGKDSTGNISVYTAGTTPVDNEVTVTLRKAPRHLIEYNKRLYGNNFIDFAQILPEENFSVPNGWDVLITKENPYTLFPITVDIDNLSPDVDYFLPIEIAKVSNYQFSEEKSFVLLQIFMKNEYATTKTTTYYQMNGTTLDVKEHQGNWSPARNETPTAFNATKKVVPIAKNAVRMFPGTSQSIKINDINQRSIRVNITDNKIEIPDIGEDGLPTGKTFSAQIVTIEPYMKGNKYIKVRQATDQLDPTKGERLISYYYPKDKLFVLNYYYHLPTDADDVWHKVKESMTLLDY